MNANNPLVSIIIPTYNRAHLIGETLDSILAQTYTNWECIIVDDGSTDNTDAVIESYVRSDQRFQYHHRPKNRKKGANACRNYGFELSKGEYINWFDSDDIMLFEHIESKVSRFTVETDIVIGYSNFVDKNGKFLKSEIRTKLTSYLLEDFITLKVSWYLPDPMYSQKFLKTHQLHFCENLHKGQDRDFHIRVLFKYPKIIFINKSLTNYRQTENSISNDFSSSTIYSLYQAENNRIDMMENMNLNKFTKLFLLVQQLKKYPFIFREKGVSFKNFKLFTTLGSINFTTVRWFFKYTLAFLSFKIFNRGYYFLKGN
ncbi:glycosyltransferase family 2 protein [Aequorivita echinoideorum]|uniref:Glycosyltransferase family 2 protein n=1 Tax=Aequorivita echinoideorum TaxID=1549647 RepID=A0ABS5S7Q1_9FLAO|nr:glycosyltransferase family 2 protein [Aequorivita echinoideorum]MBT0608444.1 glycosyltransferase family 2 protein [Aequorivita echinoideorum]